jgi:hypothetical protein
VSGPCTLEYTLIHSVLLGVEASLRSARDVATGIAEVNAAARRNAADRAMEARRLREAVRQSVRAQVARTRELEAALDRMRSLASALATNHADASLVIAAPERPAALGEANLAAYTQQLEAAIADGQAALSAFATRLAGEAGAAGDVAAFERLAQARSLDDLLDGWVAAQRAEADAATLAARRERLAKLLAPIAAGEDASALPADIRVLLDELAAPGESARVDAVELELKRLVGRERARREAAAAAAARARELLAELDRIELEDTADDQRANTMRQTLELAAAGLVPLTAELDQRARSLVDELEAAEAEALRKAAATVLEGTLADLGFVTEPISHTLFMQGGVAHFSRPEWGEYAVRLRASPADGTLNFNVVREAGAGAADGLSALIRDTRAEETWCEHIPQLQETLASRGIRMKVRRLLGAGEAPVQVVPDGTLASVPKGDARAKAPAARTLGGDPA